MPSSRVGPLATVRMTASSRPRKAARIAAAATLRVRRSRRGLRPRRRGGAATGRRGGAGTTSPSGTAGGPGRTAGGVSGGVMRARAWGELRREDGRSYSRRAEAPRSCASHIRPGSACRRAVQAAMAEVRSVRLVLLPLSLVCAVMAALGCTSSPAAAASATVPPPPRPILGAAVNWARLQAPGPYQRLFLEHFRALTPENEFKMEALSPAPGRLDFT